MRDANNAVVGIRLRTCDGGKFACRGGHEGLFIPAELKRDQTLYVCEGATDCAALLDLGLAALGRPSCTGGQRLIIDFVRSSVPPSVVVVADADAPGRAGAAALAGALAPYARVRAITPPDRFKDLRDWKRAGATASDLKERVSAAEPWRVEVNRHAF